MLQIIGKIRIHPLFWATFLIGIATASFLETLLLFSIIFIHELGHVIVAQHYQWRVTKIELLPFGGVAEVNEHGNKSLKEEIIILLAGPLQHVWMMVLVQIIYQTGYIEEDIHSFLFWNNFSLFVFNLLPMWPLDGGKLLFCLFSLKYPFREAHLHTVVISAVSLGIFTFITIFISPTNITMWCMIVFLGISLYIEWKQRKFIFVRFLLNRYYGKNMNTTVSKTITAGESDTLFQIFTNFQRGYKHFIVIEKKEEQTMVDENELLRAYFIENKTNASIGELIS